MLMGPVWRQASEGDAMNPQAVRLFVPFSVDTPWIVRREVARVGTYPSRNEAISAALAVRDADIEANARP